jgi:cyclase
VPADAQPTQSYDGAKTAITVKGRTAQVLHQPRAHTDGDSAIYFADANVLATGDIVSIGNRYPNIDVGANGNIKGMIEAVDNYIKLANDQTKVVPGHGTVMSKADLVSYRALLATARDRVAKLKAEGKTEDEVVAAKPIQDLEKQAGANEMATTNFLKLIYRSLQVQQG